MKVGIRAALGAVWGFWVVACSGSHDEPSTTCGTLEKPLPVEVKDVSPAIGASVPNSAIVMTFTVAKAQLKFGPDFATPTSDSTGTASTFRWRHSEVDANTVYSLGPMTFENAPSHFELEFAGLLQTTDDCIWQPPKQIFSFDVTKP